MQILADVAQSIIRRSVRVRIVRGINFFGRWSRSFKIVIRSLMFLALVGQFSAPIAVLPTPKCGSLLPLWAYNPLRLYHSFPHQIPVGVKVPSWAYLDVTVGTLHKFEIDI